MIHYYTLLVKTLERMVYVHAKTLLMDKISDDAEQIIHWRMASNDSDSHDLNYQYKFAFFSVFTSTVSSLDAVTDKIYHQKLIQNDKMVLPAEVLPYEYDRLRILY